MMITCIKILKKYLFFHALFFLLPHVHYAAVRLPRLISDGMVLQRDSELTVWGWASPGEAVQLEFGGYTFDTTTSSNGKWQMKLPPQPVGGPYELVFTGENQVTVHNVVFGDVWVCSGQSNMELWMGRVKEKYLREIASSENPMIRQFMVPDKYDFKTIHDDLDGGEWVEANPESIMNFTAVGYFFASELYDRYEVPIGLINAALGGSPVESWMSEATLKQFPVAYAEMLRFKDDSLINAIETADKLQSESWYKVLETLDEGLHSKPQWSEADVDDRHWATRSIPGYWTEGEANGVFWFRRELDIPEKHIGKPAMLWLGRIVDQDFAYVNGQLVGTTGYQYPPRRYHVDSLILQKKNSIAIRVVSQTGRGEFVPDKPYYLAVDGDTFNLSGQWKYEQGALMSPKEGQTFIRWKPGGLYNRMIAPLTRYAMKGVIWYQGESNADHPAGYQEAFTAMIDSWREAWGRGDFPFLYVQLANYLKETDEPVESDWAQLRQEQLEALSTPNTGMAVIIDLGEWNDIHPLNKKDVGHRLVLLARKMAYDEQNLIATSTVPVKADFYDDYVEVIFDQNSGSLKTRDGGPVRYLSLSNDGAQFHWAEGEIHGNKMIIRSKNRQHPVAVRYAWADNPATANLVSEAGLPVSPFELRKGLPKKKQCQVIGF